MSRDPMELVGRLEIDIAADLDATPQARQALIQANVERYQAAACIREMVEKREGLEEDLYQAVLVAYRRGALEWTQLNYPQWINAISAGREVCPPAPGAEA